jgi:hypothetical protein
VSTAENPERIEQIKHMDTLRVTRRDWPEYRAGIDNFHIPFADRADRGEPCLALDIRSS